MRDIREIFFSLLRISTGRMEDFPTLSAGEWDEVFSLSKKHAVPGVVFYAIERLPENLMPEKKQLLQFFASASCIERYNSNVSKVLTETCARFGRAGFAGVVLKGQGVGRLYEKPEYRSSGDIDLWCSVPRRRAVGFVRGFNPSAKVFYHHIEMGRMRGVSIEFHVTPTWLNSPFGNRKLQKYFRSVFPQQAGNFSDPDGSPVAFPTTDFNLVFMPVHIYRHVFAEGIGLRQVMDLYYVLRGSSPGERSVAYGHLCDFGMKRFVGALMWVLRKVFCLDDNLLLCPADAVNGEFLLNEIMIAGNFGKSDRRYVMSPLGKMRRLLHFLTSYPSEVLWSPFFKLWQIIFIRLPYNVRIFGK